MKESKINRYFWIGIGLLALGLQLFLIYYTYWHRHYLVPPGNDVIGHYGFIETILARGSVDFSTYPAGFHLIVIGLSKLFHLSIWSILTDWTPILIILPSFTMFFLLRQLFSLKVSVLSVSILLLSTGYPLYAFVDGNYPDMLAYGVFGVLLFAFLIRYFKTNKLLNLLWSGVFLVLIALTHHLTFFIVLGILSIFGLLQIYQKLFQAQIKISSKIVLSVGVFSFVLAVVYLLAYKLYGGLVLKFMVGFFANSAFLGNTYLNTLPNYSDYQIMLGNLVLLFGLIGFIYLLMTNSATKEEAKVKQLAIIWVLFLYVLSRLSGASIPGRFARELALPLVVSMAFLWRYLFEQNPNRSRIGQILACGVIGYLIVINSSLYTGPNKIPDALNSQIWYWPIDQSKVDYLAANIPKNEPILYNGASNLFLPVKTSNKLVYLALSYRQVKVVDNYLDNSKNLQFRTDYQELIVDLQKEYGNVAYILDDVKPQGNTDPATYPAYADYAEYKTVLESLALNGKSVQTFEDSAVIYRMK